MAEDLTVLRVKEAVEPHNLQTAWMCVIFSAFGTNSRILLNFSFRYVPFSAEVITIFPEWAASSANSTIYKKSVNGAFYFYSYVFEKLSLINSNHVVIEPNIPDFTQFFDRASCSRFNTTIKLSLLWNVTTYLS